MFQVGNGHFIAKMICIARIPQQYMYIMKRVNTGAQNIYTQSVFLFFSVDLSDSEILEKWIPCEYTLSSCP